MPKGVHSLHGWSGESYRWDMGMVVPEFAWAMARRRPREYRRKVDAATRCSGVCSRS